MRQANIVKRENGVLYKYAGDKVDVEWLTRHHECLRRLYGKNIAPKSLLPDNDTFGMGCLWPEEDLGLTQAVGVHIETEFQRGCVRLLNTLHDVGIRHGDLTEYNIVVKNNRPYAVDFHESTFYGDGVKPKRPEGDKYWMWETASKLSPDSTRRIRRWRAIRPYLEPNTTFTEYGTAMGDFLAMAEAEHIGLEVLGYDNFAQEDWSNRLQHHNIVVKDITNLASYSCHTALFMSVLPHIVKSHGEDVAFDTLLKIIAGSKQAFIEIQLDGDGIGNVTRFRNDESVWTLLQATVDSMNLKKRIDPIVTIPVYGREPLTRTVWRIYDNNI